MNRGMIVGSGTVMWRFSFVSRMFRWVLSLILSIGISCCITLVPGFWLVCGGCGGYFVEVLLFSWLLA